MTQLKMRALGCVSAIALTVAVADHASAKGGGTANGEYLSGDFHNHTTCSDGSTSLQTLTGKSLEYLDWFIQAGHSGSGNRDCRFDDPTQSGITSGPNASPYADAPVYWQDTAYSIGVGALEGLQEDGTPMSAQQTMPPASSAPRMWRWQSVQQFTYPIVSEIGKDKGKPVFVGMEWVVPGHEHTSASVTTDQFPVTGGNANGMAQFEYCFASNSEDTSGGGGQGWTCEVDPSDNGKLIKRFTGTPVDYGPPDYNGQLGSDGINVDDEGDHVKSTAGVYWMQENHPGEAYAVPAHLERAGPFRPGENRGYNVENLRDWNNAAPDVAFGFESQPGHQASDNRGEYQPTRSGGTVASSGLYTFGGTGCYAAAVAGKPGYDVDNVTPLTAADFQQGGKYYVPGVDFKADPKYVTVCQPGIRTMWDALLTEGRKWFFFASSDWHNRGMFSFNEPQTTQDFAPGEYQKTHVFVRHQHVDDPAQDIVNGLRSGNSYATTGDLITNLVFKACYGGKCATMGETLEVPEGADIQIQIRFLDPKGPNNSPYSFPNPALLQAPFPNISEPLNKPTVRYVDLIKGYIRKAKFTPKQANYTNPQPTTSVRLLAKFMDTGPFKWRTKGQWKEMEYTISNIDYDKYVRIRGSNLLPGTPYERDDEGNPLRDDLANNIPCTDAACQAGGMAQHTNGIFDYDVEGWGDLWFYSNPIFIKVNHGAKVTSNATSSNPS